MSITSYSFLLFAGADIGYEKVAVFDYSQNPEIKYQRQQKPCLLPFFNGSLVELFVLPVKNILILPEKVILCH